ncbi:MAG TPA: ferrochelatase [Mariprofundaceae bacterium]|nr:ferrochelatase [Mariprofundaceae bacterium]
MNYTTRQLFDHDQPSSVGILLTNLGTPDAPDTASLRRYLKEFLSDPRVVEQPRWLWWLVLNLVILNIRPARSAAAYRSVWMDRGSPLLVHSLDQQAGLQDVLGDDVNVELAMRYGNPSIASAMEKLRDKGCTRILVFPLYPQYSATTTGSTFDAVAEQLVHWRRVPGLRMVDAYHDHPAYIGALSASVKKHWDEFGRPDRLLMSFHGIPQRYFDNGDPYPCMCRKTARLLAETLALKEGEWFVAFQSRFGREPWVSPYADATLKNWGAEGIGCVDVICPGFSSDCLETLEEIAVENRGYFIEAGGKELRYIPSLNGEDVHIQALAAIAREHLQGWTD